MRRLPSSARRWRSDEGGTVKIIGLSLVAAAVALSGCKNKAPLAEKFAELPKPKAPAGYEPAGPAILDIAGENCCAEFMSGGRQIVFLSRQRPRHSHFQVYLYDFAAKQDRRLSFHDGDDQGVTVHPKTQQIVYASTTDFLKEQPKFLQDALGKAPAPPPDMGRRPLWVMDQYELYRAERDGSDIDRLTRHPGFDGEASFSPQGNQLVYTSVNDGRATLMQTDDHGRNPSILIRGAGHDDDGQARFSPNGQDLVFVRYDSPGGQSQIWVKLAKDKRKKKPAFTGAITSGPGIKWTPSWHPNGEEILFSSNRDDASNFEIYVVNKDGTCLRRLTYELGQDFMPVMWPDGGRLLFTSDRAGVHKLYTLDYRPPGCPP
jgi:TolB protein